jgi:hypothetical protein
MFATLALRSIKCVNSNLLGIWNFTGDHIGLIASDCERPWAIAGDCERLRATVGDRERPFYLGLVNLGSSTGRVASLSFHFLG